MYLPATGKRKRSQGQVAANRATASNFAHLRAVSFASPFEAKFMFRRLHRALKGFCRGNREPFEPLSLLDMVKSWFWHILLRNYSERLALPPADQLSYVAPCQVPTSHLLPNLRPQSISCFHVLAKLAGSKNITFLYAPFAQSTIRYCWLSYRIAQFSHRCKTTSRIRAFPDSPVAR